jgi:hypothetical protein
MIGTGQSEQGSSAGRARMVGRKLDRASGMGVLIEILNEEEVGPDYFWPFFAWWPDFKFPNMWENLVAIPLRCKYEAEELSLNAHGPFL